MLVEIKGNYCQNWLSGTIQTASNLFDIDSSKALELYNILTRGKIVLL
jgi:hypothetical protein